MKLNLDFNLQTPQERLQFLESYLPTIHPNNSNLDTMADYILWVSNDSNIILESKNSPWRKNAPLSLDGLVEQSEETGLPLNQIINKAPLKATKKRLDRAEIVNKPHFNEMREEWQELWKQIDETEYIVQWWEMLRGKRRPDLPIRQELLARLEKVGQTESAMTQTAPQTVSPSTTPTPPPTHFDQLYPIAALPLACRPIVTQLRAQARSMDAYSYLKKKRALVELRKQQYLLLDSLQGDVIQHHINPGIFWDDKIDTVDFFPFNDIDMIIHEVKMVHFEKEFQNKCIKQLQWSDSSAINKIDLRDPNVIRNVLNIYRELENDAIKNQSVSSLLKFLCFYVQNCKFENELKTILLMKINKKSNKQIVEKIKQKYGIEYKENYISTIYTKRIIQAIADAAVQHYKLIEYILMGKAVFKTCTRCGKLLPRNADYFNKRSSTSDGFFGYCKNCKRDSEK